MNNSKSHFRFSKKQRNEILFLLAIVITAQVIYFNIDFKNEAVFDLESEEVVALQRQIDSLKDIASSSRQSEQENSTPTLLLIIQDLLWECPQWKLTVYTNSGQRENGSILWPILKK
jgi:hypothetical protein